MKIWLDDVREPPDPNWIVVRSEETFKELIGYLRPGCIDVIGFDHDLGSADPQETGYDCARWLLSCYEEKLAEDFRYYIQSSNGPGRKHIEQLIDRHYEREHGESVSRKLFAIPT